MRSPAPAPESARPAVESRRPLPVSFRLERIVNHACSATDDHSVPRHRVDDAVSRPAYERLIDGSCRRAIVASMPPLVMSARMRAGRRAVKRAGRRLLRTALLRYVRGGSSAGGAEPQIVILLNTAWGMGGTIRTTLNLAEHLAPHHDVQIISVVRARRQPFFELPGDVEVDVLDDRRLAARPSRSVRLLRNLLATRSSVLIDPSHRSARSVNLWVDLKLARSLRGRRGLLIATRPGFNLLASELSHRGLVTIGQEHMNLAAHPAPRRADILRRYPRLDALTVLTHADLDSYRAALGGRVRLERIPNTVRDMGPANADLEAKVVITAGRLGRQKGYDLLIPAFARVAAKHPDWQLRILGKGDARGQLEALIDRHGLAGVVRIERAARDLGAEMANASIYVLSSRFEGMPLVLLEAMSKGMAVVSFDCPTGPADIIDDHRNGLLIPPNDVEALADGISELIEDEALRRRCGAAAIETARGYTMDVIGPMWDALLRDLLPARAPRASA
jgi:glycosyltransferase involved in cell wall biosynthesis